MNAPDIWVRSIPVVFCLVIIALANRIMDESAMLSSMKMLLFLFKDNNVYRQGQNGLDMEV